jgi:hypothetical protein
MRIPQIQIQTTDIQMNYHTSKPVQRIEQSQATININQPAAIIEINTTNPQMDVDMSQFWRDVGKQSTGETIREHAQKAQQERLQGISRRVGEGRQMMLGAGKGQNTMQSIAIQNHGPKRPGPIGLDFIPSYNSIKVSIQPGTTDVNITQQNPKIDVQVKKPIHDYTPGEVNGTMVQRPNIEIDVIG